MKANQCPECGGPLENSVSEGLCPQCLMAVNVASQTRLTETEAQEEGAGDPSRAKAVVPPAEIAKLFPGFEIIEVLGRGGMGVVYKARQKSLDRLVALKVLAPERTAQDQFSERFSREARILANLNHPNIVTVHDFGQVDGRFYLIMELVDGANLRQLLKQDRIQPEVALSIVPDICAALEYAHRHGVVHRDIKPENVLVDALGQVKIADFGIAKILGTKESGSGVVGVEKPGESSSSLTQEARLGTPSYMAPEQKAKPKQVDHRADIYSLGIVFYEMLTGELPSAPFQRPSKKVAIDVRIDETVIRAIEQEPERRYQTAGEFRDDVETVVEDNEVPSMLFDWRTWSPFQSELARKISSRMTESERRAMFHRDVFVGLMFAVILTFLYIGMDIFFPAVWLGGVVLMQTAILVLAAPFLNASDRQFKCATAWARSQGITSDDLKKAWQDRLDRMAAVRWLKEKGKRIALVGVIVISTVALLGWWLQRPKTVGATISATTPNGMLNADAQTVHVMRIFGGDETRYRFRVQGYAGAIRHVWEVAVPLRALATEYSLLSLSDIRFDRNGTIVWSEDERRVSFRVKGVEVFAFNTVDSSHSFEAGFQAQQEVTLMAGTRLQNAFLDLDTGVVMSAPNDLVSALNSSGRLGRGMTQIADLKEWMQATGADVVVRPGLGVTGLLVGSIEAGDGTEMRRFETTSVEDVLKAAEALEALAAESKRSRLRSSKGAIFGLQPGRVALFVTREGAAGVIEVLDSDFGSTAGPIRLRFKRVDR